MKISKIKEIIREELQQDIRDESYDNLIQENEEENLTIEPVSYTHLTLPTSDLV